MDARHAGEMYRHLEKRNELLQDTYRSLLHELQNLQEEEKELRHKFCEVMSVNNPKEKKDGDEVAEQIEDGKSKA
jgi:hypothetical protein